ncbi:hypothetical protein [Chitinophaga barathri]|uniref:Uncharacterized protein n=1 Tax=Chitinophaga barathri TaxID=1647451 RepID=A0A3N4MG88_9BACT|nr:hypothetical protein [Chitinophaga barathri]RPD39110.1 hypothetical protein EG028_21080 [Chitinophaga barathri]
MVDIEKIADSIRPKEMLTAPYSEYSPVLDRQIFLARDIQDLSERRKYILEIIETERGYDTTPYFIDPLIKAFAINGKTVNLNLPEKIRRLPDQLLISQCETELTIIDDLLYITQMAKEYCDIQGTNQRQHYLFYAKGGQVEKQYREPQYYSESEYAQIVSEIAKAIDETSQQPATDKSMQTTFHEITPREAQESVKGITIRAIALYYYYLSLHDRNEQLTANNAAKIAARFGFRAANSGNDLFKNHYRKVMQDKAERVSISNSRRSDQTRLNNLATIVSMLQEQTKMAAYKSALQELDEMQRKFDLEYLK